jgi:hypothetical protein
MSRDGCAKVMRALQACTVVGLWRFSRSWTSVDEIKGPNDEITITSNVTENIYRWVQRTYKGRAI